MLATLAYRHEDLLASDLQRFYGLTLWASDPQTVMSIVPGLVQSRETLTHRALNPDWYWGDPLFAVTAMYMGIEPPKHLKHDTTTGAAGGDVVAVDVDEARRLLALPRTDIPEKEEPSSG